MRVKQIGKMHAVAQTCNNSAVVFLKHPRYINIKGPPPLFLFRVNFNISSQKNFFKLNFEILKF